MLDPELTALQSGPLTHFTEEDIVTQKGGHPTKVTNVWVSNVTRILVTMFSSPLQG